MAAVIVPQVFSRAWMPMRPLLDKFTVSYAASVADLGNLYFVHKVGIFLSFISLRTREYYGDITDISLALRAEYHAEDQR